MVRLERVDIHHIINASLNAVHPRNLIPNYVKLAEDVIYITDNKLPLHLYRRVFILGSGKAAGSMAEEIEDIMGEYITHGLVSIPYGHKFQCSKIECIEASHPITDLNALRAGKEFLNIADKCDANDLIIFLLSGGGSALIEVLPDRIPLDDLHLVNELLLKSGMNINEINTIRRHISLIKGGKLASAAYPAKCISLIISDVIGDSVQAIASGPTVYDLTTPDDALTIIRRYNLESKIPRSVKDHLKKYKMILTKEQVKGEHIIIGNNETALIAAYKKTAGLKYNPYILNESLQDNIEKESKRFVDKLREMYNSKNPVKRPACLIAGGEVTVNVQGSGKGGRNQEFVLRVLAELKEFKGDFIIASFGTDGIDGPTDAAGGIVTSEMLNDLDELNLDLMHYLSNNDSYTLLSKLNGLIKTGPTGTNVSDVIIALLG